MRALLPTAAAAVVVSATAVPPSAHAQPGELEGARIARVDVTGNRRVETEAVRVQVQSRAGEPLRAERVRADVRAVWNLALFDDVRAEAMRDADGDVVLRFAVRERPAVRKVLVDGNVALNARDLDREITLRKGLPVDRTRLAASAAAIAALYRRKGHTLAVVTPALTPAGAGELDVTFRIDEGPAVALRQVSFLGNRQVSDRELSRVLALSSPSTDDIDRELARVIALYLDRGHLDVAAGPARVELSSDRRGAYVRIPVVEGPRYRVAQVEPPPGAIALGVAAGDVASASAIRRAVDAIRDHHRELGHAWASVEPVLEVDRARRAVSLRFRVDPGPRVYVERIRIRGAGRTTDRVIRRELAIAEGELYRQSAIERSRVRVAALGYFERVDVATGRGSSDAWITVDLSVDERQTDSINVGLGYSTTDAVLGNAQLSLRTLLGRGQSLELAAVLSRRQRQLRLRLYDPHLGDTRWAGGFDVYDHAATLGDGRRHATGGSFTLGRQLSETVTGLVTYKLEHVDFSVTGLDRTMSLASGGLTAGELLRDGLTSSVTLALHHDTRNDRLLPTAGSFHTASIEVADPALGSDNTFVRVQGAARHYRPLPGPFVLKLRAEAGAVTSRDPRGVPLTERYQAGGLFDVRGFAPGSLGPQIAVMSDDPASSLGELHIGGNLRLLGSAEIEFPLVRKLGISGVVFADVGNAYNLERRFCAGESIGSDRTGRSASLRGKADPCTDSVGDVVRGLRSSVGFGVRWISPIGPLRFEWGIPLDRQDGERPIRFEFSIGGSF